MGGGFGEHRAGASVKRRVKRQRAVTIVFETVAFQASGRQRQHRIEPVESLDGTLLVDAEHRRVLRRLEVQADNIGGLALEIRIVGSHVALDAMRLEPRALPYPCDHHMAHPHILSQLAATPVGGAVGWRPARYSENFRL